MVLHNQDVMDVVGAYGDRNLSRGHTNSGDNKCHQDEKRLQRQSNKHIHTNVFGFMVCALRDSLASEEPAAETLIRHIIEMAFRLTCFVSFCILAIEM